MTGIEVVEKIVTRLGSLWPFPVVVAESEPERKPGGIDNYESPAIIGVADQSATADFLQSSHKWMESTLRRCPTCERLDPQYHYRPYHRTGCSSGMYGIFIAEPRISNPESYRRESFYREIEQWPDLVIALEGDDEET